MITKPRSSQQFCRCGHARSFIYGTAPEICGHPKCECEAHDTAKAAKPAKLRAVEPSPNAMARDAAEVIS